MPRFSKWFWKKCHPSASKPVRGQVLRIFLNYTNIHATRSSCIYLFLLADNHYTISSLIWQSSLPGMMDSTAGYHAEGCGSNPAATMPYFTVVSKQREWRARNIFSPLPQRQNVKKFEHENGWGLHRFHWIAAVSAIQWNLSKPSPIFMLKFLHILSLW